MKICIVAAGLATRLQPLTNYIPKFLINIGKQTGLVEMVRYWNNYSDEFVIIVHPKYEALVKAYFEMYFDPSNVKLTIKTIDTALGTAHTIDTALGNEFDGEEILFTWCDIIPSRKFDINELDIATSHGDGVAVLTVDNKLNRYKFHNNALVQEHGGDVVGLYYMEQYEQFTGKYVEGQDFADYLTKNFFLNKFELDGIIDFGDKEKLFDVLQSADEAREFNAVEIYDTLVRKYALNDQGRTLIAKEIAWYKEIFDQGVSVVVPKVFPSLSNDEMIMERVDGCSIYKRFGELNDADDEIAILRAMVTNLDKLHSIKKEVGINTIISDTKKEAHDKLLTRYEEIKHVIAAFGTRIDTVNGVHINNNLVEVVGLLFNEISAYYINNNVTEYSLIHGDLQMSNSMVSYHDNDNVTFIDPRGYFGNTQNYGLPDYDIAKVLYSLSGYDLFNYSKSFHISSINETEIKFEIPRPNYDDLTASSIDGYFEPIHYLWLAVIWIGLAGYIKNNPVKSVAAHYHGLAYAQKVLNKDYSL